MSDTAWAEFVGKLESAGYFKYTRPEAVAEVKEGMVLTKSLVDMEGYFELTGRVFAGDAERLAEGGVVGFLYEISPFLQSQGVRGMIYLDQHFQQGQFAYAVHINLDVYTMLAEEELGEVIAWVAVPARAFDMINRLLEKVGSRERVYSTQGSVAQNSFALFLTPELYDVIADFPLLNEDEKLLTVEQMLELI